MDDDRSKPRGAAIGARVRECRKQIAGMTLEKLSDKLKGFELEVSVQGLSKWEKGERLDFNSGEIEILAKALNCTQDYLTNGGSKLSQKLIEPLNKVEGQATSPSTPVRFDNIDAKILRIVESLENLSVRLSSLELRMAKLEVRI